MTAQPVDRGEQRESGSAGRARAVPRAIFADAPPRPCPEAEPMDDQRPAPEPSRTIPPRMSPDDSQAARPRGRRLPHAGRPRSRVLIIALLAGAWLVVGRSDTDSSAGFAERDVSGEQAVQTIPKGHPADDGFRWPIFGGSPQRTHALAMQKQIRPPFKTVWVRRGDQLLEFTPVSCGRSLYLLRNDGVLIKISRRTGAGV